MLSLATGSRFQHPEPEVRASPNFRCAELIASDPKPGTPKKVKVYEIMQESKKGKGKVKKQTRERKSLNVLRGSAFLRAA